MHKWGSSTVDNMPVDISHFNPQVVLSIDTGAAPLLDRVANRQEPQPARVERGYPQIRASLRSISITEKL
jgi:hypothetical protein